MANARYADGRSAVTHEIDLHFGAEAALFRSAAGSAAWHYDQVRRVDDGNGQIALRLEPDTGERLILDAIHMADLRAAAPILLSPKARGEESWRLLGGLTAAAASLALMFLVGVPLAAKPIAQLLPIGYGDRIGQISWAQVDHVAQRCTAVEDQEGQAALNSLGERLTLITRPETRRRLHVTMIAMDQPNAFALADGSVVVTKPLVDLMQSPDELAGVLAHEIGHIDERHVMANVIRHVGAGAFIDIVFGGGGAGQAVALASVNLASLRYSRDDEAEADERGFDFMDAAGFNPGASAALFERLGAMEHSGTGVANLLQTHPPTPERAARALSRAHPSRARTLSPQEWQAVRAMCGGMAAAPEDGPAPLPPGAPIPSQKPPGGGVAPLPPASSAPMGGKGPGGPAPANPTK